MLIAYVQAPADESPDFAASSSGYLVLVIGLIASRTVPHVILESNYRHRVPIEPFLILLASVAVVGLVRSASRPMELAG